jgi:S-adenosylmethionine hydrolase
VALRAGGHFFVGPDNGLVWAAATLLGEPEARLLVNPDYRLPRVSHTFHGRDLFAPAAAHLASGATFESVGPPATDPARWEVPAPRSDGPGIVGEILALDRFGNAMTNLEPSHLAALGERWRLEIGDPTAPGVAVTGPASHYGAVPPGEPVVVLGSHGYFELAVNRGSAADRYRLRRGDRVQVRRLTKS